MKALLAGSLILGDIQPGKLKLVNAKNLYMGFTSTFPPPKITFKYDIDWNPVWMRLQNPVLDMYSRDIMFMIIHNIVANKERVHRFRMTASPIVLTVMWSRTMFTCFVNVLVSERLGFGCDRDC